MRKVIASVVFLLCTGSLPATPAMPAPRASPEFVVAQPGGRTILLSSLRGKVVLIEFMFINSAHCRRVAETLNKLNGELGSRGFQPLAVVFDPPNTASSGQQLVTTLVNYLKLTFPVGYTSKDSVDSYLGRSGNEILNIPQVVVIDRAGIIRATSGGQGGDRRLEDESSLRTLLGQLLETDNSAAK